MVDYGVTYNALPHVAFKHNDYTVWFDVGASQGPRGRMEDRWCAHVSEDGSSAAFLVFDGHGGDDVADYLAQNLSQSLLSHPDLLSDPEAVVRRVFKQEDDTVTRPLEKEILGSTAVLALLLPDKVVIANVGDSRGLAFGGTTVADMRLMRATVDHRPGEAMENERLARLAEEAGACPDSVVEFDMVRGDLAVSRAFGNPGVKDVVKADPDIFTLDLYDVRKVVLVSDGITDVVDNDLILSTCLKHVLEPKFCPTELERLLKIEARTRAHSQPGAIGPRLGGLGGVAEGADRDGGGGAENFQTPRSSMGNDESRPSGSGSDFGFPAQSYVSPTASPSHGPVESTPPGATAMGHSPWGSPCTPPWGAGSDAHGKMLVDLAVDRRCRDNVCALVLHIDRPEDTREAPPDLSDRRMQMPSFSIDIQRPAGDDSSAPLSPMEASPIGFLGGRPDGGLLGPPSPLVGLSPVERVMADLHPPFSLAPLITSPMSTSPSLFHTSRSRNSRLTRSMDASGGMGPLLAAASRGDGEGAHLSPAHPLPASSPPLHLRGISSDALPVLPDPPGELDRSVQALGGVGRMRGLGGGSEGCTVFGRELGGAGALSRGGSAVASAGGRPHGLSMADARRQSLPAAGSLPDVHVLSSESPNSFEESGRRMKNSKLTHALSQHHIDRMEGEQENLRPNARVQRRRVSSGEDEEMLQG